MKDSWGGRRAQAVRASWQARLPLPCLRCGTPIQPHEEWDVGHRIPRSLDPSRTWDPDNQWPEHASCNRAAGATLPSWQTSIRRPW